MKHEQSYDVIIIGSGISGLSSASILSQLYNKRVLVLERHWKIGGFTHIFKRVGKHGTYYWDVGLHYIGEMQNGTMTRAMFDFVTQGKVKWQKINDPFDMFVYPDFTFGARTGKDNLKQDIKNLFPQEEKAIEKYFHDLEKVSNWNTRYHMAKMLPDGIKVISDLLKSPGSKLALMTTKSYMDETFRDDKLKALLVSQWGDHGMPPSKSSFNVHSIIVNHYLNGGYYPVGTSKTIADSIIPVVENAGGKCLANHTVTELIIENEKVIGVKAIESNRKEESGKTEKEFHADTIISSAGAEITFTKLMPENYKVPFEKEVIEFPSSMSHVTLYLGLKDDPRKLGFNGENYWIYSSYDHEDMFNNKNELVNGKVSSCYLSFPSLKDPNAKSHTAEIIAFMDYEPFKQWADKPWKKRGEDYQSLKDKIAGSLIELVDVALGKDGRMGYKWIRDIIDVAELSTPLSTEFFTGYKNGAIYGIPATPERYKTGWIGIKTPVKNLFMTGTDATSHGITGGLMGGALTVGTAFGGYMKIFREAMKFHKSIS